MDLMYTMIFIDPNNIIHDWQMFAIEDHPLSWLARTSNNDSNRIEVVTITNSHLLKE